MQILEKEETYMDSELFADLAARSQDGDPDAPEQLLLLAHTPVSFLCRKLLQNDPAAKQLTKEILRAIPGHVDCLGSPEDLEKWLYRTTTSRCMRKLEQLRLEDPDGIHAEAQQESLKIPAKNLDEDQTAQMVLQLVDDLPEYPRLCLLLYCCGGAGIRRISRLTGLTEEAVQGHLDHAQKLLNNQLHKYHRMGIRFAAVSSLPDLLRTAMDNSRDTRDASAMIGGILPKKAAPAAPVRKRRKKANKLLAAVVASALLLLILLVAIVFLELSHQEEPEPTTVSTTLAPTETTAETTAETTMETTEETTSEPTEATTEPTTIPTTEPTETAPPTTEAVVTQTQSGGSSSGASSSGSETGGVYVDGCTSGQHNLEPLNSQAYGKFAGCTTPGWALGICINCHEVISYEDPVNYPPKGHDYREAKTYPPTTTSQGYTEYYCTRCFHTYYDNYVDPLPAETEPPTPETAPAETSSAPATEAVT